MHDEVKGQEVHKHVWCNVYKHASLVKGYTFGLGINSYQAFYLLAYYAGIILSIIASIFGMSIIILSMSIINTLQQKKA